MVQILASAATEGLVDNVENRTVTETNIKSLSSNISSFHPSDSIQQTTMSSSSDPILGKHSHTASECVTKNGDPLVVKKKACAAEKASTTKKL